MTESFIHAIAVGHPYAPGYSHVPEGYQFNWSNGRLELLIVWNAPTPQEVEGVRRAPLQVGLVIEGPIIFFLYQFKGFTSWGDAPYTVHMVPIAERHSPPALLGSDFRAVLSVVLVDAQSGIVQGIRLVTLSPTLTHRLFEAIRQQAVQPFDQGYYEATLQAIYEARSSEDLVRQAEWIETAGS